MKRSRRVGLLVGVLVALVVVLRGMASPNPGDTSALRRLVFDERFAGGRLDGLRWSRCYWWAARGCTIATNHELEWYLPGQVQVGRGVARLIAARRAVRGTDGRTYSFVSGMISSGPTPRSSAPKFAFRYGRVEARLRVPAGAGLWSAFWLLPANRSAQPEIDIMEIHGDSPGVVRMHLHYRGRAGHDAVLSSDWTQRSLRSGWHRYGIDWRPGHLAWLIDGVVRWHVDGAAVPRARMYLIADLAVGGDPVGVPTARTPFPSALAIDWVRVWQ
jgi:beta-glucanase (GH16 family)